MSVFKKETWIKKGYTEEEAAYQIKIRRPSNVEYYIHKFGVGIEEAVLMRLSHQKKTSKHNHDRPVEQRRKENPKCIEYWLDNGYTEEEGRIKISESQITFSLEICIEKYGVEEGTKIWQDRQDNWQKRLKAKPQKEIDEMNSKKGMKKLKNWVDKYGEIEGKIKFRNHIIKFGGILCETLEEIEQYLIEKYKPFDSYLPVDNIVKKIPAYCWELVEKPQDINSWVSSFIELKAPVGEIIFKGSSSHGIARANFNMYVDGKLLRSSLEILFFQKLSEAGLTHNVDYTIEKYYKNSKMRCDFHLTRGDVYVEICGESTEIYTQKMQYKKSTFGSILLWEQKEYGKFVEQYVKEYY